MCGPLYADLSSSHYVAQRNTVALTLSCELSGCGQNELITD
jgi:hypothetical protein